MFIARSLVFYPGYFEDECQELSDEVILPSYFLNRLIEQFDDGETLYLNMTNADKDLSYLVTIGKSHSYDKNVVYAPQWLLELIGCTGNCDSVIKIQKADIEDIPAATKIIIKPLDPIAFEIDTVGCFEKAFMNLHSIKEGIIIPVSSSELGGDYIINAYIDKVEPAAVSRIIQSEVAVEFVNDFKVEEPRAQIEYNANATVTLPDNTVISAGVSGSSSVIIDKPLTVGGGDGSCGDSYTGMTAEEQRQRVRDSWLKRFRETQASPSPPHRMT